MEQKDSEILQQCYLDIVGVSYIGNPKEYTAMYVTQKVMYLIDNLKFCSHCLVFIENGIEVPEVLKAEHHFIFSPNPQLEYAKFVNEFAEKKYRRDAERKYILTNKGYYVGENVQIGRGAYIEPGCLIGHDVIIGAGARVYAGSIIKNAVIGDYLVCNENAIVGSQSFTMAVDDDGNRYRIASMGQVIIGNYVEIGAGDNIAIGGCGNTIIDDYVKLDALIHVGHEVHIHRNVELTAGVIIAGFVDIEENVYVGINASIRNRISVGANSTIGMGSNVTKDVPPKVTVAGNPAKKFIKNDWKNC